MGTLLRFFKVKCSFFNLVFLNLKLNLILFSSKVSIKSMKQSLGLREAGMLSGGEALAE